MSGGTSLVHPRTAHLPPDEQMKGTYVTTTPEELSRLASLRRAEEHRLNNLHLQGTSTGRFVTGEPEHINHVNEPKRVARKVTKPVDLDFRRLEARLSAALLVNDTDYVLDVLDTQQQHCLFERLAEMLGYSVE